MVMRIHRVVILACLVALAHTQCTTTECESGKSCDERLWALSDRLSALETSFRTLATQSFSAVPQPRDCADIKAQGHTGSGIYIVYFLDAITWTPVSVYCDMQTAGGGWLVFQRRQDGSEDFYRNWANYADGFGDLHKEFWLGNNKIHKLTSSGQYKLRVDLEDFEGKTGYAEYSTFSVGAPSGKYTLTATGYSGNATNSLGYHNGRKFSTKDQDNDSSAENCATGYNGAWWYGDCHYSNLNGQYLGGPHTSFGNGLIWRGWTGHLNSLKFTEMKFKP